MAVYLLVRAVPGQPVVGLLVLVLASMLVVLPVYLLVLASMLVVSMYRGSTIEALEPHVVLVENAALWYCAPAMGPAIALYYFIPPAIRPRAHEYVKKKKLEPAHEGHALIG